MGKPDYRPVIHYKVIKRSKTHWDVVNLSHNRVVSCHLSYKEARKSLKDHRSVLKLGRNWARIRAEYRGRW